MVGLRSAPPPAATVVRTWILADFAELRQLRADLRHALDAQALIPGKELDDLAERMSIVATELATNALNHARSEALVQLSRTKRTLVLDVADELPSVPPRLVEKPTPGSGGRGLRITQELALDAGWYTADRRKHVWAQFGIPRRKRLFHTPRIPVSGLTTFVRLLRRMRH